ncbi:MAG: DUF2652 domain-containing protein [Actinomycetota bacterium]|nr:DUF2652 domain-containing protein [Actinomycetota bacterium]
MATRTRTLDRGCLVLADISGYTSYVVSGPLEHAEDVVADVTESVAARLGSVLTLNKYEGDAVFGYGRDGTVDAPRLLDAIDESYFTFRGRLAGMQQATSCSCKACAKLPDLDLKFVVHHGDFVRRGGRRSEELTGAGVIVAHRLLKNTLGRGGYVLLTDAAVTVLGIDPSALGMREHVERYDDVGEVRCFVRDLEERRMLVGDEADFEVGLELPVPPDTAWRYLTAPAERSRWHGDVDVADATTADFCVDGRVRFYEEILDWQPFSYFTEARALSRSARVVLTTELEGVESVTRVRTRGVFERRGRPVSPLARRRLVRRLRDGYRRLGELVAA